MVRMIRDLTGRFAQRPYYLAGELDRECEQIVTTFLTARHGNIRLPIATDELSLLIELEGADLDSCVDLSPYGDDVEGVTAFYVDREPDVMISDRLANDPRRENRLRTTLAHEFGHVRFHRHLWAEKLANGDLFAVLKDDDNKAICKRDTILNAHHNDWMEWQAGYISGAILMPVSAVRKLVDEYCTPQGIFGAVALNSDHGQILVHSLKDEFQVSEEAARVRLQALKLLSGATQQSALSF